MSNIVKTEETGRLMEQVLIGGDMSKLTAPDRVMYYKQVCESVGLNPLTKPFEYINLNGKLTLYAKRDCTDQLRSINGVSIVIVSREVVDDCYVVTARATDKHGRHDESIGAVPIANLKGEAKSNALMKAETKAKRRVTLSVCGLGLLDETEISSIPGAYPQPSGVIAPTSGAAERVQPERIQVINELAVKMQEFCNDGQFEDAVLEAENCALDADERVYLWTNFDAPTRKQLKVASKAIKERYAAQTIEAQPAPESSTAIIDEAVSTQASDKISDAQRKRLEAIISKHKLNREDLKLWCSENHNAASFADLTKAQYKEFDEYIAGIIEFANQTEEKI